VLVDKVAERLFNLIPKAALRYRAGSLLWTCETHIKGVTSHDLRKKFQSLRTRLPSLWTNSYFASTVGGAPLEVIKQYVDNQKNV